MSSAIDHERVRRTEDRSLTFELIDLARAASTGDRARSEAFRSLGFLEDYRSVEPLIGMVEERSLPEGVRRSASLVVAGFDDRTTGAMRRSWWASGDDVIRAHALRLMERSEADVVTAVAGDGRHPLQALALSVMAFGFDEPAFQGVTIRALDHPDAGVRCAAAKVLLWDEPVAAEVPLLRAAHSESSEVAVAAIETLEYYPSRVVLRALAELANTGDDRVRSRALESLDGVRGRFEDAATYGGAGEVARVREWMAPVADLLAWPETAQARERHGPSARSRVVITEADLMALITDPDGEWAARKNTLRQVAWDAYSSAEQGRLSAVLTAHPDPFVRETAAVALTAWSRTSELIALARDPCFGVRKSAIYSLGLVPREPALAFVAWEYMTNTVATTAGEALDAYVVHAPAAEAIERLVDLTRNDARENIRTRAVAALTDLGARSAIADLVPLLRDPPRITWALHVQLLAAIEKLRLPTPGMHDLEAVDNLDVIQSIARLKH